MMDELIHWSKPCLLLSATCGEILSWLIEIWMKVHLVSDSSCNSVNLESPHPQLQRMTNNVGFTFSVGDIIPRLQLVLSKTIRISDMEYHI